VAKIVVAGFKLDFGRQVPFMRWVGSSS